MREEWVNMLTAMELSIFVGTSSLECYRQGF